VRRLIDWSPGGRAGVLTLVEQQGDRWLVEFGCCGRRKVLGVSSVKAHFAGRARTCLSCRPQYRMEVMTKCQACGRKLRRQVASAHKAKCAPCKEKNLRDRTVARQTGVFGRQCLNCQRGDFETRWSNHKNYCCACDRARWRAIKREREAAK